MTQAHTSGPVPLDSNAYVGRKFEIEAQKLLIRKEWVLLLGPRQCGKTSAIIRILEQLKQIGFSVAFLDLQKQPPCSRYEDFLAWVGHVIWKQLHVKATPSSESSRFFLWKTTKPKRDDGDGPSVPAQPADFVEWLQLSVPDGTGPLAIVIDEAASIPNDEWRNSFYGQIRSISVERASAKSGEIADRVTFLFSGTFRAETLVETANSPFNVCREILTDSLSVKDAARLYKNILGDKVEDLTARIFEYVGGQPYLFQLVLSYLEGAPEGELSTRLEETFGELDEGTSHVSGILSQVAEQASLISIVSEILEKKGVRPRPADVDVKFLKVLGLVENLNGKVGFANKYYEKMVSRSPQLNEKVDLSGDSSLIFHEISEAALGFMKSVELKEIAYRAQRAAVIAHNSASYRFALAGYGLALEALLIDWLTNVQPSDLTTAIKAAKPKWTRYEVKSSPGTWRLANLIKVGREIPTGKMNMPPDISDAIREWRNCIHPTVMLKNYESEEKMKPYATTAAGLLGIVLHQFEK